MKYRTLVSEVGVVFEGGDRQVCTLPLIGALGEPVKARFSFAQEAVQADATTVRWRYRTGTAKHGTNSVIIDAAGGDARWLAVSVHGTSDVALDVLEDVWVALHDAAKQAGFDFGEPGMARSAGKLTHQTYGVVELPVPFEKLFPAAARLQQLVQSNSSLPVVHVQPRFSVEFRLDLGSGRSMTVPVTFEPKADETADKRLAYTRSPLDSTSHQRVMESFVQALQ